MDKLAKVERVTHRGVLMFGDISVECAVTESGQRALGLRGFAEALGMTGHWKPSNGSSKWPSFLTGKALEPYLRGVLAAPPNQPFLVEIPHFIRGKHIRDNQAIVVRAEIIPDICWAYVDAEGDGALHHKQRHVARQARKILRELGDHAMRDLVDRATGYTVAHVPEPAPAFPLPKTYAEALRMLADTVEESEAKDKRLAVAEPRAAAWNVLADPRREGDFDVGTAAKILDRDPSISIGRNRLFKWMLEHGMTYKANNGRRENYLPYQKHVDAGRLVMRIGSPWKNPKTGAIEVGEPQLRITVKGLGYIHRELGGTAPLDMSGGPEEPPTPPALQ